MTAAEAAFDMQNDFDQDQDQSAEQSSRAGRPRSEKARKKILEATRRLLTHMSMDELSIEAIAKKAKVGKTTIYRWWPNKAAVAMEAFLDQPGLANVLPSNAPPAAMIKHQLESLIRQLRGQNGKIIAGIIAESQSSEEILELMYESFLKDRVGTLYAQFAKGQESGAFNPEIDADIAIDMMMGPLFLRVLSGENAIDDSFAAQFPRQALLALAA
ncbi:MAG: TetR/AcrR family transcriptional regulator [Alphaproteobacteria bacterium]|nr:TetR/AcrR family transcriptional regulator [Alphaproteobacteria bacterium]